MNITVERVILYYPDFAKSEYTDIDLHIATTIVLYKWMVDSFTRHLVSGSACDGGFVSSSYVVCLSSQQEVVHHLTLSFVFFALVPVLTSLRFSRSVRQLLRCSFKSHSCICLLLSLVFSLISTFSSRFSLMFSRFVSCNSWCSSCSSGEQPSRSSSA